MNRKNIQTYIKNLEKPKCPDCGLIRGHKKDCILYGTRNTEPAIIIPETMTRKTDPDGTTLFYLPLPDTTDEGFYITRGELCKLIAANKNRPAAIQYISDMMEGYV